MREKLKQYVQLLFAGATDAEDIKDEILQNTLDKYDDLIDQGKSPEAAYRLAISGIGDVNEILGGSRPVFPDHKPDSHQCASELVDEIQSRKMRAVAVALYILCPTPLFILGNFGNGTIGLCLMFLMIAAATALLILAPKQPETNSEKDTEKDEEKFGKINPELKKFIDILTVVLYFAVSLLTQAWHVTWLIFLIKSCVFHLINAIQEMKEERKHEA